jgi:dTDP-4-amino-4,6-dideoxygalactose transaminase
LKPKFVDVDPETLNMAPDKISAAISQNSKAIQVIHLGGNPCDMKPIKEICEDHKLILIEDCAQALGAEYYGEKVGTFGNVSCFSFAKPPLDVRGGIICSKNQDIISKIDDYQREFLPNIPMAVTGRDLGGTASKVLRRIAPLKYNDYGGFFQTFLYRPSKLLASVALFRLRNLQNLLEGYTHSGSLLTKELGKLSCIRLQKTTIHSKPVFTKLMVEVNKNCIDVIKKLREGGIYATHLTVEDGGLYQQRFDKHPLYSQFSAKNCMNYLRIHDHIITLPILLHVTKDEIECYCEQLNSVVNGGENERSNSKMY